MTLDTKGAEDRPETPPEEEGTPMEFESVERAKVKPTARVAAVGSAVVNNIAVSAT